MSAMPSSTVHRSLDLQREEFARRRFLAMPLAGALAWSAVAVAGWQLSPAQAALALYVASGMIVYLGIFLSRFTGEHFLDRNRPKNAFDGLFMRTVAMSLLVFAIAIPFALRDNSSVPLSVGILGGLMWLPFSWIVRHWVGTFHALARTGLIVATWFAFPDARFVAIPLVIVATYAVTIVVLERRWRAQRTRTETAFQPV